MRWKYIERGEFPDLGDVCLIVKRKGGLCIATFFTRNCYFSTAHDDYNEDILVKDVIKWINIDEIKNNIECDDDGREHDYEMFPAHLYVTGIKCDPENGETEYSLKSKTIKADYANKDDDEKLFDAAKRRLPIIAEFKYVGSDLHIRNVEIVEHEDES
jgi:hypothetical protein